MRRLYLLLTGAGVLGLALGCHHVAGKCDCDIPAPGPHPGCHHDGPHANGLYPASGGPASTTSAPPMTRAPEDLNELPKPKPKDMPE
jgi:hypothetical protein